MHDDSAAPPTAPRVPAARELHGQTLTDEYAWMRDTEDPRLLAYLRDERAHYDRETAHLADLRRDLFAEVERRLLPTDESVSWRHGDRRYWTRSVTGSDYEQFLTSDDAGGPASVLIDEADFATEPGGYVEVEMHEPSQDNGLLAYAVDTDGNEIYTLRFRDTATGTDLPDSVPGVFEDGAWSSDSAWYFYTVLDPRWRAYQVWRHRLGTDRDRDVLVYQEDDQRFNVTVRRARSGRYIFVDTRSRDISETWFLPADRPTDDLRVVRPRQAAVDYSVEHSRTPDEFLIVTDLDAPEFRLVTATADEPGEWRELAAARPGERLHACHPVAGHLVMELRRDGYPLLRIVDRAGDGTLGAEREITSGVDGGNIELRPRFGYDEGSVTVETQSLVEPNAWYDVDLASGERTLRKRREVPGYDPAGYRTARRHAPAADGTLVPVTLAWREGTPLDGTAPCQMWGYGSYEACYDPEFDPLVVSLLDRGVVYALTHPRGGGYNGRAWWQGGRMATKANTFTDHLAVANWLAGTAPDATGGSGPAALVDGARIATRGLSAGGLLQAAVMRLAPARWAAIVAEVPFVDVINSMLDPSIPLTINEWEEWGDPRKPADFAWMHAYAPYENLPASPRPPLLVTGAVNDTRVLVHEPAKWVARLRATAADGDETLFRVELGTGAHGGPSGRYAHFAYEAEVYSFTLHRLGAA
ncbi:MAG TPA: prolyl oligopeptidase family serine peptidase [Micromonosporaceae bacterium]|nr:prolyl oligopeptidase family serine peptidase [Micromonosporaceae bacterium]